jgi:hypothetical protein
MSDNEDEQSPNPRFWLEFRTFDDGMARPLSATSPIADNKPVSFPQFSRLPPEIRCQIWEFLIQPRIIVASCLQQDESLSERRKELRARTTSGSAVPALLQVNQETREIALKHYELTFSWRISKLLSDTPVSKPARVWFNFKLDALFLTGELEAYDTYGFNSPMVYFLRREDTFRVRHIACAFRELGYPDQESDQIFGCLWHVVDRFPGVDRLLLTVRQGDEEAIGNSVTLGSTDNMMQKIWNGWMCGTTVTNSKMADKQMLLVREESLADFIASHTPQ